MDTRTDFCHATDDSPQPTHQNFRWTEGPHQDSPYAEFLEMAIDGNNGIATCLQIAYASDLARAANVDADPGHTEAPAVSLVEADQLRRMAMLMAQLLGANARHRVDELNASASTVD
jgi:hypothetical protein